MRFGLFASIVCLGLAACSHEQHAPPPPTAPEPQPKPAAIAPHTTQKEAEQLCLLQARTKDGARLSDAQVTSSKQVDVGYLTKLTVGAKTRTCIVTTTGDIRSYK